MATFRNIKATENIGGGFYTSSPFTIVDSAVAERNYGPGFVDDSGNGSFAALMRELLSAGATQSYVDEVHSSTGKVMNAVRADDKESAFKWYARVMELAADHTTILAPLLGPLLRVLQAKWPF